MTITHQSFSLDGPSGSSLPCPIWRLVVSSLLSGTLFGTIGVGSGIVLVPLLTMWCRVPIKPAMGASLAATVVAGLMATAWEALRHPEHLHLVHSLVLFGGALLGVRIGSALQGKLPDRQLAFAFAGVLLFSAIKFAGLLKTVIAESAGLWNLLFAIPAADIYDPTLLMGFALVGLLGGISSPLFGLGGGILYVPGMMILFYGFEDATVVRGVSIVAVMLTTCYSTYIQSRKKLVPMFIVKPLIPGMLVGAILGDFISKGLDSEALKMVMAVVVVLAAIQMVLKNIRKKAVVAIGKAA